jgi:tetratricopeptide (TPR) repeat protein
VRALSDGRFKWIDVPQRELYDLLADPAESHNLAGAKPAPEAEALRAALAALPGPPAGPSHETDREDAAALRSLGYIGAGGEYALARSGMDPKAFAPIFRKLVAVRELCEARRFADAVPLYLELASAFPRSSTLLCELGLSEMASGRLDDAKRHLRLALERNPSNSHALLGMANLAINGSDFKGAERYLLDALALDPDDVEANFNLGALYAQQLGQPASAVRYWERFIELQPEDPEAPRIRQMLKQLRAVP